MGIHGPAELAQDDSGGAADAESDAAKSVPLSYTSTAACDMDDDNDAESLKQARPCRWLLEPVLKTLVAVVAVLTTCSVLVFVGHLLGLPLSPPTRLCSYDKSSFCPADELLENPEVHEVAAATLMEVGRGFIPSLDWVMVKAIVVETFGKVRAGLERDAPGVAAALHSVQVTGMQKEAMLSLLRLVSLPSVQLIGFEIAKTIREGAGAGGRGIKAQIHRKLVEHREEVAALRGQLVPGKLFSFWGERDSWAMTLAPENVRAMKAIGGQWMDVISGDLRSSEDRPQDEAVAQLDFGAQSDVVRGGALEEARVVLDMTEFLAHTLGLNVSMPRMEIGVSKPFGDGHLLHQQFTCELRTRQNPLWFLQVTLCLLKFGIQGVDALRVAPDLTSADAEAAAREGAAPGAPPSSGDAAR